MDYVLHQPFFQLRSMTALLPSLLARRRPRLAAERRRRPPARPRWPQTLSRSSTGWLGRCLAKAPTPSCRPASTSTLRLSTLSRSLTRCLVTAGHGSSKRLTFFTMYRYTYLDWHEIHDPKWHHLGLNLYFEIPGPQEHHPVNWVLRRTRPVLLDFREGFWWPTAGSHPAKVRLNLVISIRPQFKLWLSGSFSRSRRRQGSSQMLPPLLSSSTRKGLRTGISNLRMCSACTTTGLPRSSCATLTLARGSSSIRVAAPIQRLCCSHLLEVQSLWPRRSWRPSLMIQRTTSNMTKDVSLWYLDRQFLS